MKKLFTLFAAVLLSSGAFAQEWQNLVVNGNMEGEQDPLWSSFWCHDWRQGVTFDPASNQRYDETGQFQGFAEIVEDPADPSNHCARVIVRSKDEAYEAGNPTTDSANNKPEWCEWDCQFFIYANEVIPEGKEVRISLRIKAENAGTLQTQAHYDPGNYNHYQLFGDLSYTTEWTTITTDAVVVDANHTQSANGKFFQSVAFNLTPLSGEANVIYFDDIKFQMRDAKGPSEFEGWLNFLRKGTLSDDHVQNYTTFTGRDGVDGIDRQARVIDDPVDGQPALNVTSIGWNAVDRTPVVDENGDPVLDENGDPTYDEKNIHIKENGDTLTNIDDWQTQFFVTVPHVYKTGQPYKLVMWARADKDASVSTQAHVMPGGYKHWDMVGTLNLTPEWQQFVFGEEGSERTISSEQNGCQTIAFNCNILKEENNYYFRFEDFSFNKGDVTLAERVVGSENITLPVPEPDKEDGIEATVDMTNCMNILYTEALDDMLNDDHLLVLKALPEEGDPEYTSAMSATTGFFLNNDGLFDENGKLIIEVSDESTIDNVIFYITNTGDSFADKTASTTLLFTYDGWYYKYNVAFVSEEYYNNGVADLTVKQPTYAIYDLSGRRVENLTKGLYIMNGKKFFVK